MHAPNFTTVYFIESQRTRKEKSESRIIYDLPDHIAIYIMVTRRFIKSPKCHRLDIESFTRISENFDRLVAEDGRSGHLQGHEVSSSVHH